MKARSKDIERVDGELNELEMIEQTEIEIHWCSRTHRSAWEPTVERKVKEGVPKSHSNNLPLLLC